jgi:hypothetical protein
MRSFIFSFKPILIAVAIIASLEAVFSFFKPNPAFSDFIVMAPIDREKITNIFIHEKIRLLSDMSATEVFVGDSSTFYGIDPRIVMESAPESVAINLGCCAVSGFRGYRLIAEAIMKSNPNIHDVMLGITPYYVPSKAYENGQLADSIEENYVGRWAGWEMPSDAFRLAITNGVYAGQFVNTFLPERVVPYWDRFEVFWPNVEHLRDTLGWMPRPGVAVNDPLTGNCEFNPLERTDNWFAGNQTLLGRELESFAKFARARKVRLWLFTNPVACRIDGSSSAKAFDEEVRKFLTAYPEVQHPLPMFRVWPDLLFLDRWHLSPEGAARNSREIGKAIHDKRVADQ